MQPLLDFQHSFFMKKQLFLALSFAAFMHIQAQKMYVNLYGGYSMPTTKESFASPNFTQIQYATNNNTIQKESDELIATTLGGGSQVGAAFGYQLTEHFALELGAHYLNGTTQKARGEVFINYGSSAPTRLSHVDVDIQRKSTQLRLAPAVVIRGGGMFKILYPYARFGLIMPVNGKTISEVNKHFTHPDTVVMLLHLTNDSSVYSKYETHGQVNIGLQSALGFQVKLGIFGAFIEVAHQALSIRADKTDLIQYTRYGKDAMSLLPEYEKHTEYLDKVTSTNNNVVYNPDAFIDPNLNNDDPYEGEGYKSPKQDLRVVGQYSNIGVNIGVQVRF